MATKKKDAWTKEEEAVFAAFGIGAGEVGLRRFISGQRKINGRLYAAIELILDSLPKEHSKTSTLDFKKLATAEKINDGVPGPPPGCDKTGLPGSG
jgi:hypothetical protein